MRSRSGVIYRYTSVCIIFIIIQRPVISYSAYTTVATPQDIDQRIYFKAFVRFFDFHRYCEDYLFRISSNASLANSKTSFETVTEA